MSDERVKILQMLEEGKITVDEASDLLEAIGASADESIIQPDDPMIEDMPTAAHIGGNADQEPRRAEPSELTTNQIVEMGLHDIQPAYVREMHAMSPDLKFSEIVQLGIHGIKPQRVKALRTEVPDLAFNEVMALSMHGIEPQYVREMRALDVTMTKAL